MARSATGLEGGVGALWSPTASGFVPQQAPVLAVDVTVSTAGDAGPPEALFDQRGFQSNIIPNYSHSRDGREFLLRRGARADLNWLT